MPAIADFFSVSTDELLGYRVFEREERLAEIKREMARLSEVGTLEERIHFARLAISRYPSDFEIKNNLAVCLYHRWHETKDDTVWPEAESLALSVVENCKEEDARYDAINALINLYAGVKRADKALDMANRLAPMKYCREFAKASGVGDGQTERYIQDEIDKLADSLGTAIHALVLDDELPNDPSTWDKKIRMMEISNELYHLIYGDNPMFYHCRLAFNHWIISTYQMSQGKAEETLSSLQKMCQHAVAYDKSYQNDHGKCYTSVLVDKIVYPEPNKDFHELTEHSQCWYMLDRLKSERYDPIRSDNRFVVIEKALKEHAR